MDPGKAEREQREIDENPLFARGAMGLERLKWEYHGQAELAAQIQAQT